jgi:NADH dehydrogenase
MLCLTGATGFLGRHVLHRLLAAGESVRCLVRPHSPGLAWLQTQPAEAVVCRLEDPAAVSRALRNARQVIHLAAPVREARDAVVDQFHREATACLVEAARAARVERFLLVSPMGSGASAGAPFLRGCGIAEESLRTSGLPYVILQSSLMFGAGDRLLSGMIRLLRQTGLVVIPGTGATTLQPIWVGDVVSCLCRSLREEEPLNRTLPIGGPQHLTFEEIADQVSQMVNLPRVKLHFSRRALSWTARLLEGLGRSPFPGYRHLELLEVGTITAPDAVKRTFGFQPMSLIEGVAYLLTPESEVRAVRPPRGAEQGARGREPRAESREKS